MVCDACFIVILFSFVSTKASIGVDVEAFISITMLLVSVAPFSVKIKLIVVVDNPVKLLGAVYIKDTNPAPSVVAVAEVNLPKAGVEAITCLPDTPTFRASTTFTVIVFTCLGAVIEIGVVSLIRLYAELATILVLTSIVIAALNLLPSASI